MRREPGKGGLIRRWRSSKTPPWLIGPYAFDDYLSLVKAFHGNVAPGLVIGGFMVDLARRRLPEGLLFDAICETRNCLPDAVQLLTPCTIGNGWLKVINLGRFAVNLYDKYAGGGGAGLAGPGQGRGLAGNQ